MFKRKILIVDDQIINRKILSKLLSDQYDILEANNGLEAFELIKTYHNDVSAIILDLVMPVMDGYELLELMKKDKYLETIPVIVASQDDKEDTEQKALEFGARDFISKPYNPAVLKRRLSNLIELYESNIHISNLRQQTLYDKMTGLYNRTAMETQIREYFIENTDGVFFMLDIDNFKTINDTYGHGKGDEVLKLVAEELKKLFRNKDCICRMGGDEFSVFVKAKLTKEQVISRLQKINEVLYFQVEKTKVSCSIGAAISPMDGKDYQTLYKNSDIALLNAKRKGKNCFNIYGVDENYDNVIEYRNLDWILDEINDAVIISDLDTRTILYVNNATCNMFNYPKNKCIGASCYDIFKKFNWPCDKCIDKKHLSGNYITRIVDNNEKRYYIQDKLVLWGNKNVRFQHIQDITSLNTLTNEKEILINQLKKSTQLLNTSMKLGKLYNWDYDVINDIVHLSTETKDKLKLPLMINNPIKTLADMGYVRKDCIKDYTEIFKHRFNETDKEQTLEKDVYFKITDSKDYVCMRHIICPIYNSDGKHITSLGVCLDITELKKTELKYQMELEGFKKINENNLIMRATYNLTKNALVFSVLNDQYDKQTLELKKYSYDESLRITSNAASKYSEKKWILEKFSRDRLFKEYQKGNDSFSYDYRRIIGNEHYAYIKCVCKTFLNPQTGDLMCFILNYDITEEKILEETISRVIEREYDYLAVLDMKSKKIRIIKNKTYLNTIENRLSLYEYVDELNYYANKYVVNTDKKEYVNKLSISNIKEKLETVDQFEVLYNSYNKEKNIVHKKIHLSYLDKAFEQVLISCSDITLTYVTEQKQKQAIMAANIAKTNFLSTVSHDMRTPLNGILGFTELMLERKQDEDNQKDLKMLKEAGVYLKNLINDTLDISKIESGELELHPTINDMKKSIHESMSFLKPLLDKKNIKLNVHRGNLHYEMTYSDATRIRQVFMNIIGNAIKFSNNNSKIDFYINELYTKNNVKCMEVIVKDYGVGMSEEFIPYIFEPFKQEHSGTTTIYEGTGLGMSITKKLIELMGGKIKIDSTLGEGTTVTYTYLVDLATKEQLELHKNELENIDRFNLNNKKILLCEDHPLNITIITRILEKWGCIVTSAKNGQDGLNIYLENQPNYFDAILMDIRMPIMDGLETSEKIRTSDKEDSKTIPIIALSANAFEEDIKLSKDAGMSEHLSKPIDQQMLLNTLIKCIYK